MAEPEATRPVLVPRRRVDPVQEGEPIGEARPSNTEDPSGLARSEATHPLGVLSAVAVVAAGLGLGAASGSVFDDVGTNAAVRDAIVPAVVGGLAGGAACAVVLLVIRVRFARNWPAVMPFALTAAVVALALGALAGASMAPSEPVPDTPVASSGAITVVPAGSVDAAGVVVPVDRDADGEPDTSDGDLVLGFDVDDDDVVDGLLRRCSGELDPLVEERPGYIAIDLRCDSDVDTYLPFDEERLLSEFLPSAAERVEGDGIGADTLTTIGLVIILLALLFTLGFFLALRTPRELPAEREFVMLSRDTAPAPDEQLDLDQVATALAASLDEMYVGDDPRVAISVAYATLLDGLAGVGLERRPEEAPDEHIERCFRAAELPVLPIRELLGLFVLGRFSSHPISEAHRARAIAALEAAITSVRRLEVVG